MFYTSLRTCFFFYDVLKCIRLIYVFYKHILWVCRSDQTKYNKILNVLFINPVKHDCIRFTIPLPCWTYAFVLYPINLQGNIGNTNEIIIMLLRRREHGWNKFVRNRRETWVRSQINRRISPKCHVMGNVKLNHWNCVVLYSAIYH